MKIRHYTDVPPIPSDRIGIVGADQLSVRPLVTPADGARTFSMSLLELAPGGSTPDHSHGREEEIFVQSGRGVVKCAGEQTDVGPGSVLYLGPNEPHQFVNTGDEILELLCVTNTEG
jgi:quercetin dioxygenase-like cupin family protein